MSGPSSALDSAAALRGVTRRWPGGVTALAGIDLDIPTAATVALVGPNGGGKSTLLALLAGRLAPTAGTITVLGLDPAHQRARRELRRRVGHVTQDLALDPEATGAETLALFAALYGVPRQRARDRCAELTEEWGLSDHIPRRVRTYSGGLKRRLHLALGEIYDCDLLLLDEPTTGLDAPGRDLVWHRVNTVRERGGTVVTATHDLVAAGHCDLVAVIADGRVLAAAQPNELLTAHRAADLSEVYAELTGAQPSTPGANRSRRGRR